MRDKAGKHTALSALIGALSGLAASLFGMLLAPAFLAFTFAAWGMIPGLTALAACAAVCFALAGGAGGLYILGVVLPAAFAIGYILNKKLPYRTAVTLGALLMGAGCYMAWCLPSILSGLDPFTGVSELMSEATSKALETLTPALGDTDLIESVKLSLSYMDELAPTMTVMSAVGGGMIFALADTLIARALAKKAGAETKPMAPFALWQLSRQYTWASLALLLGALVALAADLSNADAVFAAAECVVLGPLLLMGLCYVDFLMRMAKPRNAAIRIAIYAAAALLMPYSLFLLIGMGLMDRFTKVRRKFRERKKDDQG